MTDGNEATALESELTEVREALGAVKVALGNLDSTVDQLRNAKDWGLFDTFLGGGLFSSYIKRDKLRDVDVRLRSLDQSLAVARKELADVGVANIQSVGVSELNLTLDVWFDNFFSDLITQSAMNQAGERLQAVGVVLVRLHGELGRRETEIVDTLGS